MSIYEASEGMQSLYNDLVSMYDGSVALTIDYSPSKEMWTVQIRVYDLSINEHASHPVINKAIENAISKAELEIKKFQP